MTTANSPASKEVVTAALLVIGSKILSGRTKDQNIGYIAQYLTALGIDLKEVRVVGDEERAIVDALNALRHRCTYVFTTGGIGLRISVTFEQLRPSNRPMGCGCTGGCVQIHESCSEVSRTSQP